MDLPVECVLLIDSEEQVAAIVSARIDRVQNRMEILVVEPRKEITYCPPFSRLPFQDDYRIAVMSLGFGDPQPQITDGVQEGALHLLEVLGRMREGSRMNSDERLLHDPDNGPTRM